MRKNAPEYTKDHTYLHKREAERTQGQTHMDGYGLDGLWACHKACHKSTHVPLHVIQVFIFRLLSVPFLFDICKRMHTNANECKRIHMNADECIHE